MMIILMTMVTTTLMMTTTMTMMIYDSWFMIPKMTFWLKAKLGWVGRVQWKVFWTQVRFTSSEHFCHLALKFTSTFTSSAHFCHLDLHLLHISTHHLGLIQTGKRLNSIIWAERNRQCVCIATLRPCSIYTATNIPENTNYPLLGQITLYVFEAVSLSLDDTPYLTFETFWKWTNKAQTKTLQHSYIFF